MASVCVIGAGCSGLTAVKTLMEAGITDLVCYEKNDRIGGNWVYSAKPGHSSVCETTHIISSKKLSGFSDFPMPEDYPDYPSHQQVLSFFESYADAFGLHQYIRLKSEVDEAEKTADGKWKIRLKNGASREFDYLLVSNGHHSEPRHPNLPGEFYGEYLHAHDYKMNSPYKDKKVLVIGAGNSGCDCAVEISRVAERVDISLRSPQYILPKFFMGKPIDLINNDLQWVPEFVAKPLRKLTVRLQVGRFQDYGLPEPDFPVTKAHPTVNSELLYKIRHGKIHPRGKITRIEGKMITFDDGFQAEYDTIIAATGYKIHLPFFDPGFINYEDSERVPLYLRMFHPDHPTLIFIGLVQPQGAIWPLSEVQSKLATEYINGNWSLPENLNELAEKDSDKIQSSYLSRKRHTIEVDFHAYKKSIEAKLAGN